MIFDAYKLQKKGISGNLISNDQSISISRIWPNNNKKTLHLNAKISKYDDVLYVEFCISQ